MIYLSSKKFVNGAKQKVPRPVPAAPKLVANVPRFDLGINGIQ